MSCNGLFRYRVKYARTPARESKDQEVMWNEECSYSKKNSSFHMTSWLWNEEFIFEYEQKY